MPALILRMVAGLLLLVLAHACVQAPGASVLRAPTPVLRHPQEAMLPALGPGERGGSGKAWLRRWPQLRLRGGQALDDDESDDPDFEPMQHSDSRGAGVPGDDGPSASASGTSGEREPEASLAAGGGDVGARPATRTRGRGREDSRPQDSDVLDDSALIDVSSEDPTDGVVGGSKDEEGDGDEDVLDDDDMEQDMADEEEDEEEDEEDGKEGAVRDDEAVEEEVEESVPEKETGEAREARLLAQKLQNRSDLRQERIQQIVKRYERREKHRERDAEKSRQRYQERLASFLGIQPRSRPRTLHQRVSCEEGACSVPPSAPQNISVSQGISLVFDDAESLVVGKESELTLADAIGRVRAGQTIQVKLGSHRWSRALEVALVALSGSRPVAIHGECSADRAQLTGGQSVPLGPRLIGRWEVQPDAIGTMKHVTLFYNASRATPFSATTTRPAARDAESEEVWEGRFWAAQERAREGGLQSPMQVDGGDGLPAGGGGVEREKEELAEQEEHHARQECRTREEELMEMSEPEARGQRPAFEMTERDAEYLKGEGLGWMLPMLQALRFKDGHADESRRRRPPRTVREVLQQCYIPGDAFPYAQVGAEAGAHDMPATGAEIATTPECGADVRDVSDVTVNVQSAVWDLDGCQLRSAGGHGLILHGNSKVCIARCKLGGAGTRDDALALVGLTCADEAECALKDSVVELCVTGGVVALHAGVACLEQCRVDRCRVGLHLADFAQMGLMDCKATALEWGLVFIPEGGFLGDNLNQTSLWLYNCEVAGHLFVGSGRAGDTDIQNTAITGEFDTCEVVRKRLVDGLPTWKTLHAGAGRIEGGGAGQGDVKIEADDITKEAILDLQRDMILQVRVGAGARRVCVGLVVCASSTGTDVRGPSQMCGQAYKVIAHHGGLDIEDSPQAQAHA